MLSKFIKFVHPFKILLKLFKKSNIIECFSGSSQKIKGHQADIILVIGVILISLLSFAAGYITANYQNKEPLEFEMNQNKL
jgi:hypothetical protein